MQEYINQFAEKFALQRDDLIKKSLADKGFEWPIVLESVTTIRRDGFDHFFYKYGTEEEIRIISIESDPQIKYEYSEDFSKNNIKFTAEVKYY